MRGDITLRLPPSVLVKLERRAAHLEMSRDSYIAMVLKRALDDGHAIIVKSDPDDHIKDGIARVPAG